MSEAAHHHRDYRPRVTIIIVSIVSIVFIARSTALVLIAFDVLLDFWPDSSFLFITIRPFYLFLFSFFSALFVLLVVYAAPSGGVWCGRVVRHLLCGRGAKHVAIWSTWRRLMRFLFDSGSSPPSPSVNLPPPLGTPTHGMANPNSQTVLSLSLSLSPPPTQIVC